MGCRVLALGLVIVGGIGCDAVFGLDPLTGQAAWLSSAHVARKALSLAPPTTAPLDDFPVAILVDADPDLAASAIAGGRDLVFTAHDGVTVLDHEIERFDASTGALVAWVRVPRLGGTTRLYLYYGGEPVAGSAGTWSSDFGAVWHLGGATPEPDSAPHGNGLTAGTSEPGAIEGVAGTARAFDGVDDELVAAHDDTLDAGSGSLAVSLWVHVTSPLAGGYDSPLAKGGSIPTHEGYAIQLGADAWTASVADGTVQRQVVFGQLAALGGRWVHLAAVLDRGEDELRAIVDGVVVDRVPLAPLGSCASPTEPLALSGGLDRYRGAIDEVRVYRGVPPPGWLETEHASVADPAFLTIGPAEPRPPGT